jgi:hypothetical protein
VTDRRTRRVSLRYPERRTGFDRRHRGATRYRRFLDTYRSSPILVAGCLAAIALLGAADLTLTGRLLELGATEVNPVMAALFEKGTAPAVLFKGPVTAAVLAGIWALQRYRRVLELSLVVAAALTLLVAYQVAGLALLST